MKAKTKKLRLMGCKSKNPTVSVIIPTYNRVHLIGRAIQSVLNQTYQNFEIIIVDDASTDNTEEVVKSFDDERIRYIRHKENSGTSAVPRNTGIKAARGKYIAFQDSDDEWLPEKLEKQMEVFQKTSPEVGVVYTGFWRIKNDQKIYIPSTKIKQKEGDIHKLLLERNFVTTQAVIVKKKCFEKVGMFDERLSHRIDWEMWIRLSKYYHFKCIDQPLVISYYTPGGLNEPNLSVRIQTLKLILEKHFNDIKKDRKLLVRHYFDIGTLLRVNGKIGQSRKYFIKTILAYPLNRISLHAFFSLFGSKVYRRITKIKRLVIPINK